MELGEALAVEGRLRPWVDSLVVRRQRAEELNWFEPLNWFGSVGQTAAENLPGARGSPEQPGWPVAGVWARPGVAEARPEALRPGGPAGLRRRDHRPPGPGPEVRQAEADHQPGWAAGRGRGESAPAGGRTGLSGVPHAGRRSMISWRAAASFMRNRVPGPLTPAWS